MKVDSITSSSSKHPIDPTTADVPTEEGGGGIDMTTTNSNYYYYHSRGRGLQDSSWVEVVKKEGGIDNDEFGKPSCLSGDGMTLAVGAIHSDASGNDSGSVHIYKRGGSSGTFQQNVPNIPGYNPGDMFGWSISLSDNGSVLAIGAPKEGWGEGKVRLYKDNGTAGYALLPITNLVGGGWSDRFGHSVSLSGDGSTLAVGAPDRPVSSSGSASVGGGYVHVYSVNSNAGTVQGPIILSPTIAGFGYSVSQTDSGDFLAVGIRGTNKVQIYSRGTGTYNLRCDVSGGDAVTFAGGNSNRFAVRGSGVVKVWQINGGACDTIHKLGAVISTGGPGDRDEILFSLSDDGQVLAIADTPGYGGRVLVYELVPSTIGVDNVEYKQRGAYINVAKSHAVSLSDDGKVVAFGTGFQQGSGSADNGFAYVYEWRTQTSPPAPPPTPIVSSIY